MMKMTSKNLIIRFRAALLLTGLIFVTGSELLHAAAITTGSEYGGGKVVYLLKSGDKGYDANLQHGLIADKADMAGILDWPDALAACEKLKKNGYSDWYMPDKDELNRLFDKKSVIGGFVKASVRESFYWSSSEKDADYSWGQNFKNGSRYCIDKVKTGRVRAVRNF